METALYNDLTKSELKRELQSRAEKFSNEFNFIHMDVVKVYLESEREYLIDCIRQEEPEQTDFIHEYGLFPELVDHVKECEECTEEEAENYINSLDDVNDHVKDFIDGCHDLDFQNWKENKVDENYPMWNTLFEFKHTPSESVLQAAIDSGFGVIESDSFNPMLFVSGAGYSFMSQHWIPLFLRLPWVNAERYEGIKYQDL